MYSFPVYSLCSTKTYSLIQFCVHSESIYSNHTGVRVDVYVFVRETLLSPTFLIPITRQTAPSSVCKWQ